MHDKGIQSEKSSDNDLHSMICRRQFSEGLSSWANWKRPYLRRNYANHLADRVWANTSNHLDIRLTHWVYQQTKADMNNQPRASIDSTTKTQFTFYTKLQSSKPIFSAVSKLTWYPFLWWKPITTKCNIGESSFAIFLRCFVYFLMWNPIVSKITRKKTTTFRFNLVAQPLSHLCTSQFNFKTYHLFKYANFDFIKSL